MHTSKCAAVTLFHFRWEIQAVEKLSHCGLKRGVLTHGSSHDQKKKTYLLSFITFLGQINNRVDPERNWGARLVKQRWKLCLVVNVRTSLDHTRSQCAICFLQCHHRLLHRDCLILSFLYSSEWFSFCLFLETNLMHHSRLFIFFAFGCWLTLRRPRVTSYRTSMHILYEQMQPKSPLHCLFFVLQ